MVHQQPRQYFPQLPDIQDSPDKGVDAVLARLYTYWTDSQTITAGISRTFKSLWIQGEQNKPFTIIPEIKNQLI